MKKIIISLTVLSALFTTVYGLNGDRVCETKYSVINGINYFSGIHCTEDIKLSGVIPDTSPLRDMSTRTINDFIIANNHKIVAFIDGSGSCDDIYTLDEISGFEDVIYSNNEISYTTTTSNIETLTTEIEDLGEEYNSVDLYNTVFDAVKLKYPLGSLDFLRVQTKEDYFNKQLEIKTSILDKHKEKLTDLYKITESQKFIEGFYHEVDKVCRSYENQLDDEDSDNSEESEEEKKEALIKKYKEEFNVKLGDRLDSFSRPVLEKLSVKLLTYADTSPVFKRFSDAQRKIVKLKITALKEAIDDRLE